MLGLSQKSILHHPRNGPCSGYFLAIALLVAVSTGLFSGAGLAWGQGPGDIRVLDTRHEVDFPDHLNIGITVEGRYDIVEIKTNYRPSGSPVWAYGYSDFDHQRHVTASFSIPTSGPNYVPPGSQIEYYQVIRDSQGHLYETPTATLEYFDTRFQWEQTQIGPLALYYHDVPSSRVDDLAQDLEGELRRVESLLQLENQQPMRGFIYNDFKEALPAFPSQSRTIANEEVFHGFAFPSYSVFVGIGTQPRLIVHETTHLLLAQALDTRGSPIPSWLDEGFATAMEPGSNPYSGRSLSGQGLPLRSMSKVSGTPQEINYFYWKAESVVSYLINEHGTDSFQRFLGELRQGRALDTALFDTYGFGTDGLEAEWAASPVGRVSPSPGRQVPASPFVLFNTWFLGGLVLVVMFLLLVRYVVRKLRHTPEDDYWESPWDDWDG